MPGNQLTMVFYPVLQLLGQELLLDKSHSTWSEVDTPSQLFKCVCQFHLYHLLSVFSLKHEVHSLVSSRGLKFLIECQPLDVRE